MYKVENVNFQTILDKSGIIIISISEGKTKKEINTEIGCNLKVILIRKLNL
jgi:hypothetical protein